MDFRTRRTFPLVSRSAGEHRQRVWRAQSSAARALRFIRAALTWPLHPGVPELGQIPRVLFLLRLRFFCCRNDGGVRRRFEFGRIFARVVSACVSKDMRLKRDTRKEVRHCVDVDLYGARTEFRRRRGGMSLRRRGHCLQLQQIEKTSNYDASVLPFLFFFFKCTFAPHASFRATCTPPKKAKM